jgi:hypothetical protein
MSEVKNLWNLRWFGSWAVANPAEPSILSEVLGQHWPEGNEDQYARQCINGLGSRHPLVRNSVDSKYLVPLKLDTPR